MPRKYRWRWIKYPLNWWPEFQYQKKKYEAEYLKPGESPLDDAVFIDELIRCFFHFREMLYQKDEEIQELKNEINRLRDELWPI